MDASSPHSGQGLVPTKFVWRLGGSHVFLCGSFTRWVETVRLSVVVLCACLCVSLTVCLRLTAVCLCLVVRFPCLPMRPARGRSLVRYI